MSHKKPSRPNSSPFLSPEQKKVYNLLNDSRDNFFVTGKAGTGKSFLLDYFVNHTDKEVAIIAPTGVAALNVGGQTIHSFFRMKAEYQDSNNREQVRTLPSKQKKLIRELDALVIDEVSMISANMMDMIDQKLQYARDSKEPFGGCQMIAFGDLFQLPPVITDDEKTIFYSRYRTPYFFGSEVIEKAPFKIVELENVFRQKNPEFIKLLNHIRLGEASDEVLRDINSCCDHHPEGKSYVTLTSDNSSAGRLNSLELESIDEQGYIIHGDVTGKMPPSTFPTDKDLHLKVGAQIMMIKNDYQEAKEDGGHILRWVNGSIGEIDYVGPAGVSVRINDSVYEVKPETWERYVYEFHPESGLLKKKIIATFKQFPIKLAYAVTIHKSQGKTFDAVKIDLSRGAFAPGQTYVALSRCTNMESLYLTAPLHASDITVDSDVLAYMENSISADQLKG